MKRFLFPVLCMLLLASVCFGQLFGGKKTDDATAPRALTGTVLDKSDHPVPNAIVYLKNTKNLSVVTFIAEQDGNYRFNSLSPNVDYEVHAELGGAKSPVKTLSSFDTRKQAHINLKLEK